jgi:carboxymethylenebutenolidase
MCDEFIHPGLVSDSRLSRRTFGLMTAAVAGTAGAAHAQSNVTETDVSVKTPDGTCDAVVFHPATKGKWPAVLIWPDIMGLRPAFRDMGRRLAAQGYTVLVVNPFYRSAHAPVIGDNFDFSNPESRARLMGYRAAMTNEGVDRDAVAYLAFLDTLPQTDKPDSPHLLIAKTHAAYLVCQAQNDDATNPKMKEDLKAAFAASAKTATVEVYAANHGWTVPGGAVYNQAEAERAWTNLIALYKTALA